MKPKTLFLYLILFVGIFSGSLAGYVSGVNAIREKAPVSPISAENGNIPEIFSVDSSAATKNLVENFKETYILRENENKIALFIRYSNGDEQIHSEYDVPVNLLPKSDRERLYEGIEFDSIDDVIALVEDYLE